MANTSLSLGEHWETFIKKEVSSGRYGSASEVVRDALRALEVKNGKLDILRAKLAASENQANAGTFADYSLEKLMNELDQDSHS